MRCKPLALAVALAWGGLACAQMPGGAVVVVPGSATVNTSDPRNYVITQHGSKAIINWDSFSIGSGNSVHFAQPGRDAVVLNRVVGNDVSNIYGSMSGNGQIFLVNPNGIYFAPGARLDVGGLMATTLGIRDSDFLAGRYVFSRDDSAARAEVINAGVLKAREGGYVVLAGDYAANRGVVEARLGTVMLGSANKMTLDIHGDSLVNYAMNERNLTELAGVANSGQLLADGGRVVMTAMTARSLTSTAVNNSGLIQARGVEEKGGSVYLLADDAGIALGADSRIDASGAKGGGTVLVGGNWQGSGSEVQASRVSMAQGASITADATDTGDGGKVVLWSTGATDFQGSISARGGDGGGDGGKVEVSGKQLAYAGTVDTQAPQGKTGILLLDPTNITISNNPNTDVTGTPPFGYENDGDGSSNLNITTLQSALASSNVTVTTTSAGGDAGNITVLDTLTWTSANMLTLQAANQILINATVTGSNGTLVLDAGAGVTQTAALNLSRLALKGTGAFTLNNAGNAIGTLAANVSGAFNIISTGALTIGSVDGVNGLTSSGNNISLQAGSMALNQNVNAAAGDVSLTASSGVVQNGGSITATALEVGGSGTFTLASSSNDVGTVGGNLSGALNFRDADDLSIGNPAATNSLNLNGNTLTLTVGGALSQTGALSVGHFELDSLAGTVNLSNAGNSINYIAAETRDTFTLHNNSSNLYIQTIGAKTGIKTNNHDFTLVNTNTLLLGNGSSNGTVDAGSGTVDFTSNRIGQYGNAAVRADQLVLRTTNYAGLSGTANSVNTVAMVATGAGGGQWGQSFDFVNDKSLTIGTVNGVSGISTQNAHASVQAYGNITLANDINTGTGHVGLFAQNGGSYYNIDTGTTTITAGALAAAGNDLNLDRDGNSINNANGRMQTKVIAIRSGGGFAYQAPDELTISSNVWGLSGITAHGNVYIKTGQFAGYSLAAPYSDFYDSVTGKYQAGLVLDGGITTVGHTIYLDSASGVYQWASDNSASPPAARTQAKLEAFRLMLSGEGQFSLLVAENKISQLAADVRGSMLFADSIPLTIDEYTYGGFGLNKTITGVQTKTSLIAGSVAGGDAEYSAHNIVIASSDDPGSGSNLAMDIRRDVIAAAEGSATVNLSVGASDNHKDALVRTSNGAVVRGRVMVLGGAEDRGSFEITSKVDSLSVAGSRSALIDNTLHTGVLNVLGLGSSQGGGTPTPVGNVFLSAGGDMVLLGGKSTGNYLQLRANKLDVLGTMEMKDGARVLLQPLDMNRSIGVHNANDYMGFPVETNYSRGLLQRFSQTAAIYVGSTPALMNQDAAVPAAVKNLKLNDYIRIGADGSGGLGLGYRSLSAESTVSIWGGFLGDVYNLRLVAPTVTVRGFNVTGNQIHLFADKLNMTSAASNYKVASNTDVTLRGYLNRTVWVGQLGNSQEAGFTEEILEKFPDGTRFIISGSTDQPLTDTGEAICSGCVDIHLVKNGQFDIGNRKLVLSTAHQIYGYASNGSQVEFYDFGGLGSYTAADWNAGNTPKLERVQSALINADGTQGRAGGTWGGCLDYAACQGSNPSTPTGPGGNPVTPITPGNGGGTSTGGDNGGTNTPPPPPATPPTDPTNTTTNNANNTGNNSGSNSGNNNNNNSNSNNNNSNTNNNNGNTGNTNTNTNDPNDGMSDGGPSGNDGGNDPTSGNPPNGSGPGTGPGSNSGGDDGSNSSSTSGSSGNGSNTPGSSSGTNDNSGMDDGSSGNNAGNNSGSSGGSSGSSTSGDDGSSTSGSNSSGSGNSGADGDANGSGSNGSGSGSNGAGTSGGDGGSDGSGSGSSGGSSGGDGSGSGSGSGSGGAGSGSGGASDGSGSDGAGSSGTDDGSGGGSGSGSGKGGSSGADDGSGNGGSGSGRGDGADDGSSSGGSGSRGSGSAGADDSGSGSGKSGGADGSGGNDSGQGGGSGSGGADDGSGSGSGSGRSDGKGDGSSEGSGSRGDGSAGGDDSGSGDGKSGRGGSGSSNSGDGQGGAGAEGDGSGSGQGGGSGEGGSSGGGSGSSASSSQQERMCIGQQSGGPRNKELPDQGGSLATKPLVEVRNGGVNLDSDCSRQAPQAAVGGSGGKR